MRPPLDDYLPRLRANTAYPLLRKGLALIGTLAIAALLILALVCAGIRIDKPLVIHESHTIDDITSLWINYAVPFAGLALCWFIVLGMAFARILIDLADSNLLDKAARYAERNPRDRAPSDDTHGEKTATATTEPHPAG